MNELTIVTNASDIQAALIPESEVDGIARTVMNAAEKIMSLPGMQERYERWKRERSKQNEAGPRK